MLRLLCGLIVLLLSVQASFAKTIVYLAVAAEKRIDVMQMDEATGKLAKIGSVKCDGEPAALIVTPAKTFLFASIRAEGKLSSFKIDRKTGLLIPINTVEAGADPAHISTDAAGKYLFCAYYVAAKVTVHAIAADGKLSEKPLQTIPTADKAHGILLDAQNKFAFATHTGSNAIFQFTFDPATGLLKANSSAKIETGPKTGPRHIVFHPKAPIAYIDHEQEGAVTVYQLDRDKGTLKLLQNLDTYPAKYAGVRSCAEIRVHPSGKFVYVANRQDDSLAIFRVKADYTLEAVGHVQTETNPRSFDIEPSGQFLYAGGETSGILATFRIDPVSGKLSRINTQEIGTMLWWVYAVSFND